MLCVSTIWPAASWISSVRRIGLPGKRRQMRSSVARASFSPDERRYYNLEGLWSKGVSVVHMT